MSATKSLVQLERKRAYNAAYYTAHREEIRTRSAAYRATHLEEGRAYGSTYRDAHRVERGAQNRAWHAAHPGYRRRYRLNRKFNLTEQQYDDLLVKQGGRCAICGTRDPKPYRYFPVDHDHATGVVRGLLCAACNTCIGQVGDSPDRLRRAIAYLERA